MQTIPWSVCRSIDHMSNFQPQLCIVYKIYILVNPSIYARCFTGWAQSTARCEVCITLDHDTSDCPSPYPTVGQGMRTADRMPQSASNTMGTVSWSVVQVSLQLMSTSSPMVSVHAKNQHNSNKGHFRKLDPSHNSCSLLASYPGPLLMCTSKKGLGTMLAHYMLS